MDIDTVRENLEQRLQFVNKEEERLLALRTELQEKVTEPAERGQQEQELTQINAEIENLEGERVQLREALDRADSGGYGTCTSCGKAIEEKRLSAIPWTGLCITCAQDKEKPV